MENKCPYCNVYTEIYLKSDSKIDIEQIDYSSTENSRLEKDYKPLKPNLFICNKYELIFSEFWHINFEEKYSGIVDELYINQIKYKKLYFNNIIKKMKNELTKDKNILEIGAYYGAFGSEVVKHVNSYTGLELSKNATNFVKEKYKLNIHNTTAEKHFKVSPKYDLIVMFDVIEHSDDPKKIIKLCNDNLNKNGILIISTMNMDSLTAKILGKNYPWVMLMHKFYFTNNSLKKILEQNNFRLYKIKHDTRIISIGYLLDKIQIHFPYFKKIFNFIKKSNKISEQKIKISFFDLNIYFSKKI